MAVLPIQIWDSLVRNQHKKLMLAHLAGLPRLPWRRDPEDRTLVGFRQVRQIEGGAEGLI